MINSIITISKKFIIPVNIFLVLLSATTFSYAAISINGPVEKGIFESMAYQEVTDVTLIFDFDAVLNDRRSDEDHKAFLLYEDASGQPQKWDLEISQRGKFRRMKCPEMPPLKLNFKKKDLKNAGFADYDDMKLVTYCTGDEKEARELLLKEFLIYKMYNQLSDASYRVQLLNITYQDMLTGEKKNQLGFLIEDTAQLRARLGAEKMDVVQFSMTEKFHPEYSKTVALFQYMICNTDWAITKSKNIKYVLKDEKVIPIPFDFDFAALVSPPYALFTGNHGQTSYYDRVYLGLEDDISQLSTTIQFFSSKKESLYRIIDEFKLLKSKTRKEMKEYLDSFFANLNEIKFASDNKSLVKNPE